jgi:hypothetical protein
MFDPETLLFLEIQSVTRILVKWDSKGRRKKKKKKKVCDINESRSK